MNKPCIAIVCGIFAAGCVSVSPLADSAELGDLIELPQPRRDGDVSVEQAIRKRRSIRTFQQEPMTMQEVSQLLWAGQGIRAGKFRTAPSAGALYPLEVYVAVGHVVGLAAGVYRYDPAEHGLWKIADGDVRGALASAAMWQRWIRKGAVVVVFAAVYERTTKKYGERGIRYVHMEAGHASQNVYLQAEALGLGTTVVGAFRGGRVHSVMRLREGEEPLSIMPVGRRIE